MARRSLVGLIVGVLVAVVALVNAPSASAVGIYSKFALVTGSAHPPCLDGYESRYQSDVYVTGCNRGTFQNWNWGGHSGETRLMNQHEQKCMAPSSTGINLVACHPTARNQRFLVQFLGNNRWQIKTADTGLCLARIGTENVGLASCGGAYQSQWYRVDL